MNLLDYILLATIVLTGIWGYQKGFLPALGALLGVIAAVIAAGHYFLVVGEFFGGSSFACIVAFILIFALIIKAFSLLFWFLGKGFKLLNFLPFIASFNKVLGLVLGLALGITALAVCLVFLNKYPLNDWFAANLSTSVVARVLLSLSFIFQPLLPASIKNLRGVI